jgi:Skp family chaperone for outer membrane proteins
MASKPNEYSDRDKLNWEVEKLKAECRNLGRSFWTALLIALFAILGTIANIYFSQNQKVLSEIQKERFDQEAKSLKVQTDSLKSERDQLQAEKAGIQQELKALVPQLADAKQRDQVEKLAASLESTSVPPTTSTTDLSARIYLQYLRSQESKVAPVIAELQRRGYQVSPASVESSSRSREIFVGYYYETDRAEAEKLLRTVRELSSAPAAQQPSLVKGGARPRHYDVWLAYPGT